MTLSVSNLYSAKCSMSTQPKEVRWYEMLIAFTAGAFLCVFGYFYIQMFTYTEPLIHRAEMKWEAYYKGFHKGDYFGDRIVQEQNMKGDFMYIVRPDKSIEYINVDYDYRPIRIKGE